MGEVIPIHMGMVRRRLHILIRLAVIVLLVLDVVPEALAAYPACKSDFGRAQVPPSSGQNVLPNLPELMPVGAGGSDKSTTSLRHAHSAKMAHACIATMPGKPTLAQLLSAGNSVVALPTIELPVSVSTSTGPSPRGSPASNSAYLAQRSSVLLLI